MRKYINLTPVFAIIILSSFAMTQPATSEIVKTEDETIIGRAKGLVLESQAPKTIILNFDPSRIDISQKDAIVKLCKGIDHVKSAKYNIDTNTVELTVPPFGGSFENVANDVKKKLEETLGVSVLECRIR